MERFGRKRFLFVASAKELRNVDKKRGVRRMAKVELMKRTPERQSDHDKCVETIANKWKSDGYTVEADLPNWNRPPEIGGYIPDIMARKDTATRVCEVETEETMEQHRPQWETFERKYGASFWLYIAEKGGTCRFAK